MSHHWDEFSKSLAEESVPRRESLRRLGFVLAGAVLSPLGLESAWAGHRPKQQQDPCKSVCRCRNKWAQNQCLIACRACLSEGTQLCGSCGSYYCSNLTDIRNCGACGNYCYAGVWEYSACIDGRCEYTCAEGAVYCNGTCTFLDRDFYNCGACGVVCAYGELCYAGVCEPERCGPYYAYCPVTWPGGGPGCADLRYDSYNCGACGFICGGGCIDGACDYGVPPDNGGV